MKGRLHTRYAPVRRSQSPKTSTPRLACVKPAASVHPEPGSNSSSYILILYLDEYLSVPFESFDPITLISFVLTSLLKRLSIQYVYERNFFVFRLSLKAGAKLKLLFVSRKKNLKKFETFFSSLFFFFSCQSLNELSVFCGVQM